jgi:hypothetical protein
MNVSAVILEFPEFFEKAEVSINNGWSELLMQLCKDIQTARLHVEFVQVKEKFGRLRIHTNSSDKKLYELTKKYEEISATVCEFTGQPGSLRKVGSWFKTTCDSVYEESAKKGHWVFNG